jgi:F0F1-type ATP synthase membrane subunit a
MKSPLEQFDIINVKLISILGIDFSFNNILIPFFLILIFLIFFIYLFFNQLNIIPFYIQNIIENIYIFLISLIKQQTNFYGLF